jgi:hypothetical protein
MAKATSSRESSSKAEVSMNSDTLLTDSQNGNIEKRARRASAARHARKCTVCHHKDREFIDQDYLRWLSPKKIAREYAISHHSVVYRHADATGLRAQRRASLRATLENFIEQAEDVRATAGSVVAAVRLYAQINDQGQWTPPVRRHIIEHRYTTTADPATTATPASGVSSVASNAAGYQAATSAAPSAAPQARAQINSVPDRATGRLQPVATFTAPSAAPLGVSPDKFGSVQPDRSARTPQTTGGLPPDRLSPLPSNAAGSQAATACPEESRRAAAHSAAPPAKANKNSDPVNATVCRQPVATITAGCAVPFGASPEKFPAVSVATINLASELPVSNREHVELEHAPTH